MSEQRTGRIVKWVGDSSKGWGLINSYRPGVTMPDKFFVHASWVKTNSLMFAGLRVTFTPGPSRTEKELPTALEVHVMEVPPYSELVNAGMPVERVPQPNVPATEGESNGGSK
jgi:hypothetical protein